MTNIIDINGLPYMRVGDITVGTATTSVSFTGLDIGKDDDYLLVSDVYNPTGGSVFYHATVNGNTTLTNYCSQWLAGVSTAVTAGIENTPYFLGIPTAKKASVFQNIKLTNSGYFVSQTNTTCVYDSTVVEIRKYMTTSTFTSTSITSLTITSSVASAIGIGSRFQLYKLVVEKVADIIVATACTSVDITGLNFGNDNEAILICDFNNTSGSESNNSLYINNNITAINYYRQSLNAGINTVAAERTNNSYIAQCYKTENKSEARVYIKLTNNGYFIYQSEVLQAYGSASLRLENNYGTSTFTSTSITQLTITASIANAIGIGSRFQLYKMK